MQEPSWGDEREHRNMWAQTPGSILSSAQRIVNWK